MPSFSYWMLYRIPKKRSDNLMSDLFSYYTVYNLLHIFYTVTRKYLWALLNFFQSAFLKILQAQPYINALKLLHFLSDVSFVLRVEGHEHSIHFRAAMSQADMQVCTSDECRGRHILQVYDLTPGIGEKPFRTLVFVGFATGMSIAWNVWEINRPFLYFAFYISFKTFFCNLEGVGRTSIIHHSAEGVSYIPNWHFLTNLLCWTMLVSCG